MIFLKRIMCLFTSLLDKFSLKNLNDSDMAKNSILKVFLFDSESGSSSTSSKPKTKDKEKHKSEKKKKSSHSEKPKSSKPTEKPRKPSGEGEKHRRAPEEDERPRRVSAGDADKPVKLVGDKAKRQSLEEPRKTKTADVEVGDALDIIEDTGELNSVFLLYI